MKTGTAIISSIMERITRETPIISYAVIDYRSLHRPLLELHYIAGNVQACTKTSFNPKEIYGVRMGIHVSINSHSCVKQKTRKQWLPILTTGAEYFCANDASAWMRWEILNGVKIGEEYEDATKIAVKLDKRLATITPAVFKGTKAIVAEIRTLPPIDRSLQSYSSEGRKEFYAVPKAAIENAVREGEATFLEKLEPGLTMRIQTPLIEFILPTYSYNKVEPAKIRSLEHDYHRGYLDSNPDQIGADILSFLTEDICATEKLSAAILDNLPDLDRLTAVLKHRAERLEAARQNPKSA